jgi:heptosyltransferase-2
LISPRKILIIRPDRLGDLILSLPVAESVKRNLPGTEIHYLAAPYTVPIAPMADYVDGWLIDENSRDGRLSLVELSKRIKSGKFDCLIELKPSWRTSAAGFFSGVKIRIGTSRRFYSFFYSHRLSVHRKESGYHQTDLELAHLRIFDFRELIEKPYLRETSDGLEKAKDLFDIDQRPFAIIHPGSGGSAPNWPLEHYRKLAVLIKENLDLEVVITNHMAGLKGFDGCVDLGGKTDLESLAGLISRAEVFISGSTGPLHLADALGVKCLSFFVDRPDIGPARWGPPHNMDNVIVPAEKCRCADLRQCSCLEKVQPEEAFSRLKNLLNVGSVPGVRKK